MFGCGSLMSSREGIRCVNSQKFQSQTGHFQDCKSSTPLSKRFSDMEYRNDTQNIHRHSIMTRLHTVSLWVGYLGLGVGSLYLLFNPQKATCLSHIVGRRITGVFEWYSWGRLNVWLPLWLSENMFVLDRWVRQFEYLLSIRSCCTVLTIQSWTNF